MLRDFPTTAAAVNWEGAAEAPVSEEALPELWLLEGDGVVVAVAGPEAPPLPAEALPFSAPAPPVAVCAGERTTVPGVRMTVSTPLPPLALLDPLAPLASFPLFPADDAGVTADITV